MRANDRFAGRALLCTRCAIWGYGNCVWTGRMAIINIFSSGILSAAGNWAVSGIWVRVLETFSCKKRSWLYQGQGLSQTILYAALSHTSAEAMHVTPDSPHGGTEGWHDRFADT